MMTPRYTVRKAIWYYHTTHWPSLACHLYSLPCRVHCFLFSTKKIVIIQNLDIPKESTRKTPNPRSEIFFFSHTQRIHHQPKAFLPIMIIHSNTHLLVIQSQTRAHGRFNNKVITQPISFSANTRISELRCWLWMGVSREARGGGGFFAKKKRDLSQHGKKLEESAHIVALDLWSIE